MKTAAYTLLLCVLSTAANACNVPVFRYALERWRPDACRVILFHDGTLTDKQRSFVQQLQSNSTAGQGAANVDVLSQSVADDMEDTVGLLWAELSGQPEPPQLPYVVVRSTAGGQTINNWRGPMELAMQAHLLSSPVRETLAARLLNGHATVWLILKSPDDQQNQAVRQLLDEQLEILSGKIPLPEGIGLPGSELLADIPLLMKFSVLEIDPTDAREQFLVRLLTGFEPDAVKAGEPLVVPVFGRGRALEVIPATQLDAGLIEDLTLFLSGACSCQVKERNPGFDLLLSARWEQELFGEDAEEFVPKFAAVTVTTDAPVMVPIPPGKKGAALTGQSQGQTPVTAAGSVLPDDQSGSGLPGMVALLVGVVVIILAVHSLKT